MWEQGRAEVLNWPPNTGLMLILLLFIVEIIVLLHIKTIRKRKVTDPKSPKGK